MASFEHAPPGDAKAGEKIFKTKCAQCHTVDKGAGHKQVKVKVGRRVLADVSNLRSSMMRNRSSDGVKPEIDSGKTLHGPRILLARSTSSTKSSRKPVMGTTRTHLSRVANPHNSNRVDVKGFKIYADNQKIKSQKDESFDTDGRKIATKAAMQTRKSVPVTRGAIQGNVNNSGKGVRNSVKVKVGRKLVPHVSNERSYFISMKVRTGGLQGIPLDRSTYYASALSRKPPLKVVEVCPEVIKHEELPLIDDNSNHLEVAEYVDDIHQYYWVMEAETPLLANYMENQTDVTPRMRGILINWLIEVHLKFELMQETLFLMVTLFDRFLSTCSIKKNDMQLVGLTALLLASKYEDFWHPKVKELISIMPDSCTKDQMLSMEILILKKLRFRLNAPTPYVFMLRFLKASQSESKLEQLAFYLIELCLVEYEALKFKPSLLCASAIYVARCTLQISPAWTPLLVKHSHYDEPQLRVCADMIMRFHKAAGRGPLKVAYEKYMQTDHCCVAAIKPLYMLPQ